MWLIKLNPYIPVRSLKLRLKTVSDKHNPCFSIVSLLLSPEMRSHAGWLNRRGDVDCASRKSLPLVRPLVGWFGHQLVTNHRGVNIAGTPHRGTSPQRYRAHSARNNHRSTRGFNRSAHTAAHSVHTAGNAQRAWPHSARTCSAALALHRPLPHLLRAKALARLCYTQLLTQAVWTLAASC